MLSTRKPRVQALLSQSTHFLYHGVLNFKRLILSSITQLSKIPEKKSTNLVNHYRGHSFFIVVLPARKSSIFLTKNFKLSIQSPKRVIILAVLRAEPSFFHLSFISWDSSVFKDWPPMSPLSIFGRPHARKCLSERLYSQLRTLTYYINFKILLKSAMSPFKSSFVLLQNLDFSSIFLNGWMTSFSSL